MTHLTYSILIIPKILSIHEVWFQDSQSEKRTHTKAGGGIKSYVQAQSRTVNQKGVDPQEGCRARAGQGEWDEEEELRRLL